MTATTQILAGSPRVRLNEAYVEAIRGASLVPLVLPPLEPEMLESVLGAVSGVVVTGGEDVDPAEYGMAKDPKTESPHATRDRCEIELVRLAHDRRVPTLAICRGIQVVNVAFGGTLVQDIADSYPSALRHDRSRDRTSRVHDVAIEAGSKLAEAIGETSISVNSSHHQSLERVADGLRVTARSPDRIIEGAEWVADEWWMVGVQWHPEELVRDPEPWDRRLFSAFASAVAES